MKMNNLLYFVTLHINAVPFAFYFNNTWFVSSYQLFTFSDWASSDLRLLVTFFNSSSKSPHFLWARRRKDEVFYWGIILSYSWCSHAYSSETSALSSALSSSPSRTSSLRVTCQQTNKKLHRSWAKPEMLNIPMEIEGRRSPHRICDLPPQQCSLLLWAATPESPFSPHLSWLCSRSPSCLWGAARQARINREVKNLISLIKYLSSLICVN